MVNPLNFIYQILGIKVFVSILSLFSEFPLNVMSVYMNGIL